MELGQAHLERPLIFFGVVAVDLLHGLHVLLYVANSMFPCLESLSEQAGSLFIKMLAQISFKSCALVLQRMLHKGDLR